MRTLSCRLSLVSLLVTSLLPSTARCQPATDVGVDRDLLITEIAPGDPSGHGAWVEFQNSTSRPVDVSEFVFSVSPEAEFSFPMGVPRIVPGGFILLQFDAEPVSPDFEQVRRDLVVIHAPHDVAASWSLQGHGSAALFRPGPPKELVDFVAWGRPAAMAGDLPAPEDRWPGDWFIPVAEGFGVYDLDARLEEGWAIGLYPFSTTSTPEDWALLSPGERSPGSQNHVPSPKVFTPFSGAVVGHGSLTIAWPRRKGDERYIFEMSTDDDFSASYTIVRAFVATPVVTVGFDLDPGDYYYRVSARAGADPGLFGFSAAQSVRVLSGKCVFQLERADLRHRIEQWIGIPVCPQGVRCSVIESMRFKFQRKDSPMLCLHAGCELTDAANPTGEWDRPHRYCTTLVINSVGGAPRSILCTHPGFSAECRVGLTNAPCDLTGTCHGNQYCLPASVSMVVSAYRTMAVANPLWPCLSQDRIAYWLRGFPTPSPTPTPHPCHHLMHDEAAVNCNQTDGGECSIALKWALGSCLPPGTLEFYPESTFQSASGDPLLDDAELFDLYLQITSWIDAGRPVMLRLYGGTHIMVIAGYCLEPVVDKMGNLRVVRWLYFFDPAAGPRAEVFGPRWKSKVGGLWVAPPVGSCLPAMVRNDEPQIWIDANGNNIRDYDETERFPSAVSLTQIEDLRPSGACP